jgi:hypothetical protein
VTRGSFRDCGVVSGPCVRCTWPGSLVGRGQASAATPAPARPELARQRARPDTYMHRHHLRAARLGLVIRTEPLAVSLI